MKSLLKILLLFSLLFSYPVYANDGIKVFFYSSGSVFMEHVKKTLTQMAKQRGYKIKTYDAGYDAKKQYEQFMKYISIGDMAVISIEDEEYLSKMMEAAEEYDAKVILFGSSPTANISPSYNQAWYVGFEIFDSGRKQFSMIKKYLEQHPDFDKNANGALDVIFLQGMENDFSTHVRTQIIMEGFEKYDIKINPVSYNYDNYSYSAAYEDVSKQLRIHGINNIEMIIANNDAMALGAVKALNEKKYNHPYSFFNGHRHLPVFGVDGISDAIKSVDAGMLTGTAIADYSALSRVIMTIFENSTSDDFEKIVWFKVDNRTILIPYRAFCKIKDYNALSLKQHLNEIYMRRVFLPILGLLFALLPGAVLASETIHSFFYTGEDEFLKRFNAALNAYAKTKDAAIDSHDGQYKKNLQLNQIYSLLSTEDPMIITLVSNEYASEILYHAKQYDNRIVFFNRQPSDEVLNSYDNVWYVGTNSAAAAKAQSEIICDYIDEYKDFDRNKNGVLDLVILQGEKNHADSIGRTTELLKILSEKNIKYKILSDNFDDWDSLKASADVEVQSKKYGLDNVDMIIANNDSMAVGAIDFLNTRGYNLGKGVKNQSKYIPVFGVDGVPDAVEYIRQNKMTGTVFADFSALAKVTVDLALSDSNDERELTRKLWYKVEGKKVSIPFVKYASFKTYVKRSRQQFSD